LGFCACCDWGLLFFVQEAAMRILSFKVVLKALWQYCYIQDPRLRFWQCFKSVLLLKGCHDECRTCCGPQISQRERARRHVILLFVAH